jgi:hypothetical protein
MSRVCTFATRCVTSLSGEMAHMPTNHRQTSADNLRFIRDAAVHTGQINFTVDQL